MRISELPFAKNLENFKKIQSQLLKQSEQQGQQMRPMTDCLNDLIRTSDTLISSDKEYTKESAVMKQWNIAGSFNIYDVMNGGEVHLQKPNLSAEELQAFEKELQENGIGTNINWSEFKFDLRGIGFQTEYGVGWLKPDDFMRKADYLASRYAAMKDKIVNNFSGEEQEAEIEKLDSIYKEALDEVAGGFSDIIGGFLDKNGVTGEREKIYQSVADSVNARAEEYYGFLSQNSDFAGLKGTKDEWLLLDDEYIAARLRDTDIDSAAADVKNGSYTLKDLDILGKYAAKLTAYEYTNPIASMDEERIGTDFAKLSMQTEELRKEGNMSADFEKVLLKLTKGFMENFLNRADDKRKVFRETDQSAGAQQRYARLDRTEIWKVFHRIIGQIKN